MPDGPLLPFDHFAPVFEPLMGRRIGYVRPVGNVGDQMIEAGMMRLLEHFRVDWRPWHPQQPVDVDELIFGGGGNMGTLYLNNWRLRGHCLRSGLPLTILPQSFTTPEPRRFTRVFVREKGSLRLASGAVLAPDLALALDRRHDLPPRRLWGLFLRKDGESAAQAPRSGRDPARLAKTIDEYIRLAARYERIVTDRLHFAVAGLIAGRRVTLLPNSYHKNAAMHESWLADLGCRFATNVDDAVRQWKRAA